MTTPGPAKAITAFNFQGLAPAATGTITEASRTIALSVPYGTGVTALVPTITMAGAAASPGGGVANDFTSPRTHTAAAGRVCHGRNRRDEQPAPWGMLSCRIL